MYFSRLELTHMGESLLQTTGARINALLDRRDMTQKELARQLGISEQFLSAILRGKKAPSVRRAREIATALGTSIDYIMLASDDPAPPRAAAPPDPVWWHPETDELAQLVDAMPQSARRYMVDAARLVLAYLSQDAAEQPPGTDAGVNLIFRDTFQHAGVNPSLNTGEAAPVSARPAGTKRGGGGNTRG